MTTRIFATVGTTTYAFDRFSDIVARYSENHELQITYQFGFSPAVSARNLRAVKFLDSAEYRDELLAADIVISHAGIGTFIDMKRLMKPYLIIPRCSRLSEHVDDHQIELAEFVGSSYGAHILMPGDELPEYSTIRPMDNCARCDSSDALISSLQNWLDS